jgi:hypothetical protein
VPPPFCSPIASLIATLIASPIASLIACRCARPLSRRTRAKFSWAPFWSRGASRS